MSKYNIAVHHIGSTSVPDLSAKPIIDILVEVDCLSHFEDSAEQLLALGYVAKGENGIAHRRYFQKSGIERSHHLHGFKRGDMNVIMHLAFRDYLLKNPQVAKQYSELKIKIAKQCADNMNLYMSGKDSFIKHHLALAMTSHLSC